jgi:hypothetical protein
MHNFEVLADNVTQICPAPEGNINYIGHITVVIHAVGQLERVIPHYIKLKEFFYHELIVPQGRYREQAKARASAFTF